jgi:hypothetical protein
MNHVYKHRANFILDIFGALMFIAQLYLLGRFKFFGKQLFIFWEIGGVILFLMALFIFIRRLRSKRIRTEKEPIPAKPIDLAQAKEVKSNGKTIIQLEDNEQLVQLLKEHPELRIKESI